MKICFIGLGSIGKRHLRNMVRIAERRDIDLHVDAIRSGKGENLDKDIGEKIDHVYLKIEESADDYDIIFLTNPTRLHYETLIKVQNKARNFFIEKPIFHTSDVDLSVFSFSKEQQIYVACPMRYENTMQYLKSQVDLSDVLCARAICSSYLPAWRPGTDYRNTYSAHKDMGGGVSLDLIHEWDYLCYLLAPPKETYSIVCKKSDLQIDSDDIAVYIGSNEKCIFELHLDYFGREEIRQLQLFKKNATILADFIRGTIWDSEQGTEINLQESRDDYQTRELEYFLDIIDGYKENTNNMEMALKVLKLAEGTV